MLSIFYKLWLKLFLSKELIWIFCHMMFVEGCHFFALLLPVVLAVAKLKKCKDYVG